MLVIAFATGPLAACTTVEKGWTSTKTAVGGIFSGDKDKAAPPDQTADADAAEAPAAPAAPMTGGLFMGSNSAASAFQTSTPSAAPAAEPAPTPAPAEDEKPAPKKEAKAAKPPKPPKPEKPAKVEEPKVEKVETAKDDTKKVDTKRAVEGLLADRTKAEYSEQGGRREPVTVRPLNESAQTAEASAPPRPQAAPVEQVARLQGGLDAPAAAASAAPTSTKPAPSAAALADKLSAPAPSPAESMPDAPRAAASAQVAAAVPAPVQPTPQPAYQAPIQALIPTPAPSSIVGYGDDTVVVDSSGTRGGRNVLASAGSPRAGFDPGNASVSSEVGTVLFAPGSSNLSAQGKAILADAARLRAQFDGAIRVVGRGEQAAARAAAVSRELRRLGVPAARLYDGGADSTVLGDAADIYLDY